MRKLKSPVMPAPFPLPENEEARLQELFDYNILDSDPEPAFDDLVQLASELCGTPISLITLLDADRQWFKAREGVAFSETPREQAFCSHTILDDQLMEVPDATRDERFQENPLVQNDPNIRFYAGMPLISPHGHRLGSLCVIDWKPGSLNDLQRKALKVLAQQAIAQIELRQKVCKLEEALGEVQAKQAELEAFNQLHQRLLSALAHDLRSPLNNLTHYLDLIDDPELGEDQRAHFFSLIQQSVLGSRELLEQILHWAHQRLDSQAHPLPTRAVALRPLVAEEVAMAKRRVRNHQNRFVNAVPGELMVHLEEPPLRFILRNLLVNANKFTQQGTIRVEGYSVGTGVRIDVCDEGVGMNQEQINDLFDWKRRRSLNGLKGEKGIGIGLLLCRDFAEEIGAELEVNSQPGQGSIFSLRLPPHTVIMGR